MENIPLPTEKHKLLAPFIGKWKTTGEVHATDTTTALKIDGTDEYCWMVGGFFIKHDVDVRIGDDTMKSLEIIGYDEATNTYPMHAFSNTGQYEVMHMEANNGVWIVHGNMVRSTCSFHNGGNTCQVDKSNTFPALKIMAPIQV